MNMQPQPRSFVMPAQFMPSNQQGYWQALASRQGAPSLGEQMGQANLAMRKYASQNPGWAPSTGPREGASRSMATRQGPRSATMFTPRDLASRTNWMGG